MKIVNRMAEVEAVCGPPGVPRHDTQWWIFHKAGGPVPGWGAVEDVVGMAKFHQGHPQVAPALGRQLAYALVIKRDGTVEQGRPLRVVTPHALDYNAVAGGIALIGDFCREDPTDAQVDAACALAELLAPLGRVVTHGMLPAGWIGIKGRLLNATTDPYKAIGRVNEDPGPRFPLWRLLEAADSGTRAGASPDLASVGIVW